MNNANAEALGTLTAIVEEFRKVDPTMPIQTKAAFLFIAQNPGCSTNEVGQHLGLSPASASRNVSALLKDRVSHGEIVKGYALAEQHVDPHNRRRRIITLTRPGKELVSRVLKSLEQGHLKRKQ
jgi:DNA-binding MarR family transcriptional regulator